MVESSDTCFIERRRFPRHRCAGEVEIIQSERCWGWGKANEISLGGCYIETIHPLPLKTEVQLRLGIAGAQLDICAMVVSSDALVGMGVAFILESREQWNKLFDLIEKISKMNHAPESAWTTPPEEQLRMQTALEHLQQAQGELQEAMRFRGEHPEQSVQFSSGAMEDIQESLESAQTTLSHLSYMQRVK